MKPVTRVWLVIGLVGDDCDSTRPVVTGTFASEEEPGKQ